MSFSPKYGMIMADGAGDARNGKTPLRGVCGRKMQPWRFAARQLQHLLITSLKTRAGAHTVRRTVCVAASLGGSPQGRAACRNFLPCACRRVRRCRVFRCDFADVLLGCIRPPCGGRRREHRAGVRRACRTRNGIAFCGSRLFPLAACLGRVAAIRSGRSRIRRGTAAFWPRAAAISPKCAHFFETAHLQDDRRMGNIVKY